MPETVDKIHDALMRDKKFTPRQGQSRDESAWAVAWSRYKNIQKAEIGDVDTDQTEEEVENSHTDAMDFGNDVEKAPKLGPPRPGMGKNPKTGRWEDAMRRIRTAADISADVKKRLPAPPREGMRWDALKHRWVSEDTLGDPTGGKESKNLKHPSRPKVHITPRIQKSMIDHLKTVYGLDLEKVMGSSFNRFKNHPAKDPKPRKTRLKTSTEETLRAVRKGMPSG